MSELKVHRFITTDELFPEANAGSLYYGKDEIDKVIAEKDKEIARLDDLAHAHNIELLRKENLIAELKAKLESVQATAYTESVDAGMENRKLLRALWISRAKAYHYIAELITCFSPEFIRNRRMFTPNNLKQKQMDSLAWAKLMLKVSNKCRARAKEYE